ncbi:MAG: PrsW family glutamic-type intramembrane protease [Parcubacteria group bacterium]
MLERVVLGKNKRVSNGAIQVVFLLALGLIAPAVLLPIIKFTGRSEIIEEAAKALVILFVALKLPSLRMKIFGSIMFGVLFGLSENLFYLSNFVRLGVYDLFWQRFLWTLPMHAVTVLIISLPGLLRRWYAVFGFAGAVFLHLMFNALIAN